MPRNGKPAQEFKGKYTAAIVAELKRHRGTRRHTSSMLQEAVLGRSIKNASMRTRFDRSRREAYAFLGTSMGGKWVKAKGTNGRYAAWEFKSGKTDARRRTRRPLRLAKPHATVKDEPIPAA